MALLTGASPVGMAIAIVALFVVNVLATNIMAISGRLGYGLAFGLVFGLAALLIGSGICALMLLNLHLNH